jgi:dihydropteroate synthase
VLRPLVMAVLNVTPDSFYAPSRVHGESDAIERGTAMLAAGATILDVGGESTRPGASAVPAELELERVVPVIRALAPIGRVSVDTVKPEVAREAVAAGASLLNDVSGRLASLAAELGVGWVSMHHRGIPAAAGAPEVGAPVVAEVTNSVLAGARDARAKGVGEVYVDPGIGFGKGVGDNLALCSHLDSLCAVAHAEGFSVLVGVSRKRFLGALPYGGDLAPDERLEGSLAVAVYAMVSGVDVVRVHDVAATVQAASLVGELEAA